MSTSHRPFQLKYGSLELTLLVPSNQYFNYSQLKDQFINTLPEPTEGFAGDDEPSSPTELFSKFLGFTNSLLVNKDTSNEEDDFKTILKFCLQEFESRFLSKSDIHSFAATLLVDENFPTTLDKVKEVIRNYYNSIINCDIKINQLQSNLMKSASNNQATLSAIFGGQGNTDDYFEELREIYHTYNGLVKNFIIKISSELNNLLKSIENSDKIYTQGLDIVPWLENKDLTPNQDYLLSVPVSCPLICLIQLCHYLITCRTLGIDPGQFRNYLIGSTGHSQGLVTAIAIASTSNWDEFFTNSIKAVELLFLIGLRCLTVYPRTTLPPSMLQDSLENGEGRPSPMLSVRDLSITEVENFINQTNNHLPADKHISISLINGARNLVVSGPPESLYGLNLTLRNKKAPAGLDQSRVPHSERKFRFSNRFLPIFSPFHSHLLAPATDLILQDLKTFNINFDLTDIKIPVFDTYSGQNFQEFDVSKQSIISRITQCITQLPVNWETATNFKSSHILDFGPGGVSGLGVLTHKNKDGTGSRIILAGALDALSDNDEYGFKQEVFNINDDVKFASNWVEEFKPRLIKTKAGKVYVDTKFSKLLGRPPLMVPGMTPTTVKPEIVINTLNSGYHIELAGGGYFSPSMMERAIDQIRDNIVPGYGISINLIYVNPRMMQWGIPLIKELREKGYPIQGLTIGAGVPSLEVADEYINTLNLTHLGLKPGSVDAISQCVSIAKAFPHFPIILQWTGGRGGGHHSFEDFHQPILQMYSKIRKYKNIILIAGSGFGSDEDTYPYLTGKWANKFNYPSMPFDGVLFGSRVMTAKEAFTSLDAKKAIAACSGVPDELWEGAYKKATGGIITVKSEMGEPIHKIATRGVIFWKELDDTVFSLPKNKLLDTLKAKKDYIINKLNKDYQKPWFGRNKEGTCDLEDMTYQEVANRLIELMYVSKSSRWIDVTLRNFFGDYLRRVEERFTSSSDKESVIQNYAQLQENPQEFTDKFFEKYTLGKEQLINEEDCDYFLILCARPVQKPAPFVPVLDERFEFFFKKDSLWQSEDLEAVVDGDVQRTCILHGPVAAQFTNKVNEPIKEILDSIHDGHIRRLLDDDYQNDASKIPTVEYFGGEDPVDIKSLPSVSVETLGNKKCFKVGQSNTLPNVDDWLNFLAGSELNWLYAFLTSKRIVQGSNHVDNPVRDILSPINNFVVEIENIGSDNVKLTSFELVKGDYKAAVEIKLVKENVIQLSLIEHRTADSRPVALELLYSYQPNDGFAPILEVMEGRNDRIKSFYWKLWYGSEVPVNLDIDVEKTIESDEVKITGQDISDFAHAIGNKSEAFVSREGKQCYAPMDFAIVVGWKAIMNSIFPKTVDGDLLKLVHLSNGYRMIPGADLLRKDDVVNCKADIRAVINQGSGKLVEVIGTIFREGKPVMEVTSQFLYRGDYTDYENTFQKITETPFQVAIKSKKDLAILRSKEWFELDREIDLLDQTLTFRCQSVYKFKSSNVYSSILTTGQVFLELPTKEVVQIGTVNYEAGKSFGNPVIDYLTRNGNTIEQAILFENAIPLSSGEELTSKAPGTNEPYAKVSGDYNPIHVSRVFSSYSKLPGTITHGMYSSGSIRSLVEEWAANSVATRVRAFKCDFVGMVLPNDTLQTSLEHIGMINGRKIVKIETKNIETDSTVLTAEAEIDQPITTYVFTGQGSQEQGMGMDLYNSSEVAKEVWDRADQHFVNNYGFSILDIVKNNPNELTVHFGGTKGRKIRENYIGMMFETVGEDGAIKSEKIFKDIDHSTDSFTFVSPTGLLSATQFTQPALTLMEKASYEDVKSKGLVPSDVKFAGHSLGEYSALASLANVMPIESLVDVVFYRGMTMQVAVPRDEFGRSNYGMCAVNPARVNATFNDAALRFVVEETASVTGWLLEIVNYNVENSQYVTAGDLRALDTLTNVLNVLKLNKIDIVKLQEKLSIEEVKGHLHEIIKEVSVKSEEKPQPIDLERGFAVIPLKGISVPFHSSYLMSGVKPFERFLVKKIPKSSVKPKELINKYIPNLTAKPFEITKEYFQEVYNLTKSEKMKNIIDNWDSYEKA